MDGSTLFLLILFVLFLVFVLPRLMNTNRTPQSDPRVRDDDNVPHGTESPRYDDRDVRGSGSFGRPRDPDGGGTNFPWMNDRKRDSSYSAPTNPASSREADDRDVRGSGSFGRDKK